MLQQPINYSLDVESPMNLAMGGYERGMQQQQFRKEAQQKNEQYGIKVNEQNEQLKLKEQKREQALSAQRDLVSLSQKTNLQTEDLARFMIKNPGMSDNFKKTFEVLSSGQQAASMKQLSSVFAALETDNTDVAVQLLEDQKQAALNSGLPDDAKKADSMLKLIAMDPVAAKTQTAVALASILGPDKFNETYKTLLGAKETKGQKTAASQKLRSEFQGSKLIMESVKINAAVSRMDSVWDNYLKSEKAREKAGPSNETEVQAKKRKGALDQALIISFNKMMDPGSVVRESEYARSEVGQGLVDTLVGKLIKLKEGGSGMTDAERQSMVEIAKQLQQGQDTLVQEKIKFYNSEAELSGIDPSRVTGAYMSPVFDTEENDPLGLGL